VLGFAVGAIAVYAFFTFGATSGAAQNGGPVI
jgi:hypothetical protein